MTLSDAKIIELVMYEWMDGQTDGRMNKWTDGQTDEWLVSTGGMILTGENQSTQRKKETDRGTDRPTDLFQSHFVNQNLTLEWPGIEHRPLWSEAGD
jgi:hypothetical protein